MASVVTTSETALREAISNRDVYGGIALPAQPGTAPAILIATGASPMVAQVLSQLGAQFGQCRREVDAVGGTDRHGFGRGSCLCAESPT